MTAAYRDKEYKASIKLPAEKANNPALKDYICLLYTSTGITEFMIPERIANGIKSNVKLIGSLCTICILIAPILPIINKYGRIERCV